jgi:hypothetical protein
MEKSKLRLFGDNKLLKRSFEKKNYIKQKQAKRRQSDLN